MFTFVELKRMSILRTRDLFSIRNDMIEFAQVVPCTDREKISQPKMSLSVTPLNHIASRANECIDVLAVIDRVNDIQQVLSLFGLHSTQPLFSHFSCERLQLRC